jgi:hypothetical protein
MAPDFVYCTVCEIFTRSTNSDCGTSYGRPRRFCASCWEERGSGEKTKRQSVLAVKPEETSWPKFYGGRGPPKKDRIPDATG